jgi:hypothetical protein
MEAILGTPGLARGKVSAKIRARVYTANVGPFKVTGFGPFLDVLTALFKRVKRDEPSLYVALGSAGCLNVRTVRGGHNPSNHSWGTAVDVTLAGKLDAYDDDKVQQGMLRLYGHIKAHGLETGDWLYWGAEFSREDGMHYESSDELVRKWHSEGII